MSRLTSMPGCPACRPASTRFALQHRPFPEPRHRSYHRLVPNPVLLPSGHGHVRGVCRPRGWRDRGARRRPISSAETRSRLGRRMNRDRINQRRIIAVPRFIHPSRYRPHAQRIVGSRLQQLIPGPRAGKPTFGALSVQHSRGIRSWIAPMNELASVIIIVQVVSVSSFAPFGPEAS